MDDLRRIDLNLLLALHALLAERHVTRAALRLHKSQPAVSHALAQLRDIFKDPLLLRRGASMTLTPRAQELVQPLEEALQDLNALLHARNFDASQATRSFRLAMSDYAASLVLPRLMPRLQREAPGIDLAISQASREAMLAQLLDGEIDLALGVFPNPHKDIAFHTLFDDHFVSIAARDTLPPRGGLSLDEWLARRHVVVAMRPDAYNEIDGALTAQGLRRRIGLVLPHWSAATDVLAGTDLLLTVASRALERLPRGRGLKTFAPPIALPAFPFQQAWHTRRETDPAHGWLRHMVWECGQP